jgi:hypothetical protein
MAQLTLSSFQNVLQCNQINAPTTKPIVPERGRFIHGLRRNEPTWLIVPRQFAIARKTIYAFDVALIRLKRARLFARYVPHWTFPDHVDYRFDLRLRGVVFNAVRKVAQIRIFVYLAMLNEQNTVRLLERDVDSKGFAYDAEFDHPGTVFRRVCSAVSKTLLTAKRRYLDVGKMVNAQVVVRILRST